LRLIHLVGEFGIFSQSQRIQQRVVERRFNRADRNPRAIRALVVVIKVRTAVDDVSRALVAPAARCMLSVQHAHQ
jgi:hypothetical protein